MEFFSSCMNWLNGIIWSMVLVVLCLGVGLYLSFRMKFPQVRLFREMKRLLFHSEKTGNGISPFQAFAATVGSRVGMGNIAGVATAIFFGGPGAVFWMWCIAFIGASSAYMESSLAQAYKIKGQDGEFVGGPAYYIERGLKCKPYAMLFAFAAFLGPGLLLPGVQINSLVSVYEEAFGVDKILVGVICCLILALVVCGGIKRIGQIAELLAPVMCLIYIALAVGIIGLNITKVPGVLKMIVTSAIGVEPLFAGILGSAISWGVKRGIYSNEAGMGCGAIVSAAADCSHPAKQRLVQAFSVYVDTLGVCTATALIIILSGTYNVAAPDGSLLVSNVPNLEYGIRWTQHALVSSYNEWFGKLLAIIIVLFVFTSLMGYCYQAESNVRYLTKNNKAAVWLCRIIFVFGSFSGALIDAEAIWTIGDTGAGLMAWLNIIAILLLSPKGFALLKDYEEQLRNGKDPVFDPAKFDIDDNTHVWDKEMPE
ncbi:MAG: alanine:cation symporter family protein [Lachnospiraceae bacterium]|nr:alanine:cation symporter family protein [Lachnospiraceae bacterium]